MKPDIKDVCLSILNLDHDERVEVGRRAVSEIVDSFHAQSANDEQVSNVLTAMLKLFVSADKDCTRPEYLLYKDITGSRIDEDGFFAMTNYGADPEFVKASIEFIRGLRREDIVNILIFGIAVMCADEKLTVSEQELIEKITD